MSAPASEAPRQVFSPGHVEHVTLKDGTGVVLRLLRPDDKERLRTGFERLSDRSRYARFLAPKQHLSEEELRYLTEVDHQHHFALVAVREGDEAAGLGIARFIRLADSPTIAEAAIALADDAQGRGLGKIMFLRLIAAARERGVERFRCEVLATNAAMQGLLEQIAPERQVLVGDGVLTIELDLPHVAPNATWADPAPHASIYRLFRAAAHDAVEWTAAVRRLWRR